MSLRIIHVSDIHIRNLKYHDEYRRVFSNLYKSIEELKPDIVVNTGDTAHTKTQISPEFVEMASEHMRAVGKLCPYHIILGNHDMNLMNVDRQDAITPIIDSIHSDNIFLYKKSGLSFSVVKDSNRFNFWAFSLADRDNYPTKQQFDKYKDDVNIGLFHGSVSTCVTDFNFRLQQVEHDLSIFDGLDYALLGDIHKQQFFNQRRIAYAGSLIQQNFGEEVDKGFLLWEIAGKNDSRVTSHFLKGSRQFHTIKLNEDLSIPDVQIENGSRIRISPPRQITIVEQKEVEKKVKEKFKPYDIITLSANNIGEQKIKIGKRVSDVENIRQISVQEKLIKEFLKDDKIEDNVMSKILGMNKKHQIQIDQEDSSARNVSWKLNKLAWSNLFNYGESNVVDFSHLPGLTGIFAANGAGKSNFIDIILETIFDSTTKGVNKNIFLVNDNKEVASAIADITVNDQDYEIERQIEKIKYGQRSLDRVKEWGKTTVSFSMVDDFGGKDKLVGISRPETENNIRQKLGTFDDFMLTSLLAQWNPMDIISAKETKRKEIIYRFLDLDIFGQKATMAKEESREYVKKLQLIEDSALESVAKKYRLTLSMREDEMCELREKVAKLEYEICEIDKSIVDFAGQKVKIDVVGNVDRETNRIKEIDAEISEMNEDIASLRKKLDQTILDLSKLSKLQSRFDLKKFEDKKIEYDEKNKQIEVMKSIIENDKKDLDSNVKNAKLLTEVPCGDKYPMCMFLKNAVASKEKINKLIKKISDGESLVEQLSNEAASLLPFVEKLNAYYSFMGEKDALQSKKENFNLQIENAVLRVDNLKSDRESSQENILKFESTKKDIEKNKRLEQRIETLQETKKEKSFKLQDIQTKMLEVSSKIGADQSALKKIEEEIEEAQEIKDMCSAFEHYGRVMGKDGIAYQILTQKLPLINEEINKILSNVTDFGVFLEHDAEEQSIRFHIQYGQYKSRLLELGSGAEKFLASIAIRNALMNISILPKMNMLIIDEGFGKLDAKNLESIQKMFDYLRTVFDHIIVISHLDTMKDLVDNIIEITSDEEGYAHIEIGV